MNGSTAPSGEGSVQESAQILGDMVDYIVSNGFLLIDFTGKPTSWGDWCVGGLGVVACGSRDVTPPCGACLLGRSPPTLNFDRAWSDERGVNALQMLAMINSALGALQLVPDPQRQQRLQDGFAVLTNATNQYMSSLRNAKITIPTDDNFSDDELTMLPYFTWLVAALNHALWPGAPQCIDSTLRTFAVLQPLKSDLW